MSLWVSIVGVVNRIWKIYKKMRRNLYGMAEIMRPLPVSKCNDYYLILLMLQSENKIGI